MQIQAINTLNNQKSFGAKMILEGFGLRSADAIRWANISGIFERETIMYPNDTINIAKKNLEFSFKVNNKEYKGKLGWHKSNSYNEIIKFSDDTIAQKFAKMHEIFRQSQSIVEKSKDKIKEIVNLFTHNNDKNYVADRLLEEMQNCSSLHVDSSFENDDILKNFRINWYESK